MQPHKTLVPQKERRFSIGELLIVIAMVSVIVGFAVVSLNRANRSVNRNTAIEVANYLHRARLDSIRRSPKDINQMAQVKIFNSRIYSIAIDGDHDGYLDDPMIMRLPEERAVEFSGPFPKTYIFDSHGLTVDSQNHLAEPQPMTLGNSSGASRIKFSDDGKITVLPAVS